MTTRTLGRTMAAVLLLGLAACGGSDSTPTVQYLLTVTPPSNGTIALNPSGGTYTAGTVVTVTATPAGGYQFSAWTGALSGSTNPTTITMDADKVIGATFSAVVVSECDKAANVDKKAALIAAQPTLAVKPSSGKTVKTFTTSFASVAGNALVQCPVDLQFKDLNNDSALQPYEDWTQTAEVRAADLVGRMPVDQKMALQLHPTLADTNVLLPATQSLITSGVRYGLSTATNLQPKPRATWANAVQEACEATSLGVPFVISSQPAHASGNGRVKARDFSKWPNELSLAASNDLTVLQTYGQVVSQEFRAIGVRMLLGPSADLATEPRWFGSQFTYGEDSAAVASRIEAFLKGAQGTTLGPTSLACVVNSFPGAGPASAGWDAKLGKGKLVGYPGNNLDAHLAPFAKAVTAGVAGVMPAYGIPADRHLDRPWRRPQRRDHRAGGRLVQLEAPDRRPAGRLRLRRPGAGPLGRAQQRGDPAGGLRIRRPLGRGGAEPGPAAGQGRERRRGPVRRAGRRHGGLRRADRQAITDAQIDASARRALALVFRLGLFENPYVDPNLAPALVNTDTALQRRPRRREQGHGAPCQRQQADGLAQRHRRRHADRRQGQRRQRHAQGAPRASRLALRRSRLRLLHRRRLRSRLRALGQRGLRRADQRRHHASRACR